jgi:hypothetical protein
VFTHEIHSCCWSNKETKHSFITSLLLGKAATCQPLSSSFKSAVSLLCCSTAVSLHFQLYTYNSTRRLSESAVNCLCINRREMLLVSTFSICIWTHSAIHKLMVQQIINRTHTNHSKFWKCFLLSHISGISIRSSHSWHRGLRGAYEFYWWASMPPITFRIKGSY